jgi:uncharacterized protein
MREPPGRSWLHPSVVVRASTIAGRGLFATVDLPAGTEVSRLGGRLVDEAELRRLISGGDTGERAYVDSIVVGPDRHLVLDRGSANRFGNHSCDPNLGWTDAYTLSTMAEVPAGTELVSDYSMSTADPLYLLRCHCPSTRCRQMVTGDDWRIPQLQERYDGWWVPYLSRLVRELRNTHRARATDGSSRRRPSP